jgi:hypothetical protein
MSDGHKCATKLIAALEDAGCDYTLLFHLRHVLTIKDTLIGKELMAFLEKHNIHPTLFSPSNHGFLRDFFATVQEKLSTTGVRAINPRNFLVERNSGGKERIIKRFLNEARASWPSPKQPYTIQTMTVAGDTLFMLFQTWQDALTMQRDIFKLGGYRHETKCIPVDQILEHQWKELEMPVRLMVDWEIMLSHYQNRLTREEVLRIPDEFPKWLVSRFREIRAIDKRCVIECIVKDKTRTKGTDLKISRHFIFNILGLTMGGHYQALSEVIEPFVERLKEYHAAKNLAHIPDDAIRHPVWGWDNRLLRGQNGIGTLFGRKADDHSSVALPRVTHRMLLKPADQVETHRLQWADRPNSIAELGDEDSLMALYTCSYTPPVSSTVTYDPAFVLAIKVCMYTYAHLRRELKEFTCPLTLNICAGKREGGRGASCNPKQPETRQSQWAARCERYWQQHEQHAPRVVRKVHRQTIHCQQHHAMPGKNQGKPRRAST